MTITEAPLPPISNEERTAPATSEPRTEVAGDTVAAKSADRGYVVLKAGEEDAAGGEKDVIWALVARIDASSAEQAIRRAIEKPGLSFLGIIPLEERTGVRWVRRDRPGAA